MAAGDLNRDGKPDLVVGETGADRVAVLFGRGDGTFGTARAFEDRGQPTRLAVADVNRDGRADVVVANQKGNSVGVLLGSGDGRLGRAVAYPAARTAGSVVAADLTGTESSTSPPAT